MTALDQRSDQRRTALDRANEVRLARAGLKRDVREGVIELDILLAEPPDVLRGVPVFDVLQWRKRIGRTQAKRLIVGLVSETLLIGALSVPTQARLLERVRAKIRKLADAPPLDCLSCGEGDAGRCPATTKPCGHHCNHSWTHDECCWCGETWGAS